MRFLFMQINVTATAEKALAINVGHATPTTPARKTNIPIAFPTKLITFEIIEM